ncbi:MULTISPECIES: hypothetical protein [Trichocoleus]|uniref:Uncharacterized protein n=1 Tax=Trichocoleus desertorum GB2-A4 TaxID=2933944 RepID=A0ABV0JCU2_9CYAN|nr:hypothetical protein [Trichocoleus sp. FACHB-46]MBD1864257.1 hypothetical protein [Trichocoleus sp. FACHB-46]
MLINADEILDLIAEVGTELQLCVAATTELINVEYGIPEERSLACRPVRGYVIPDRFGEMQLAAQDETRSGGFIAYVSATDFSRSELSEHSYLSYQSRLYELEYLQGIEHRGTVMLHKLRIRLPRSTPSVHQPDSIIQFN